MEKGVESKSEDRKWELGTEENRKMPSESYAATLADVSIVSLKLRNSLRGICAVGVGRKGERWCGHEVDRNAHEGHCAHRDSERYPVFGKTL
jgi:hypothetical protein